MLIGYDRPEGISWVNVGGALVGDVVLTNGQPRDTTGGTWTAGAQTISSTMLLQPSWINEAVPRVAALVGLSMAAGQKITITGKRASDSGFTYALGGNSLTQRSVLLADGSVGAWWVFDDGLDPIVAAQVTMYNDFGGSTILAGDDVIELGEFWISPAIEMPHRRKWSQGQRDPLEDRRSITDQPWPIRHITGTWLDIASVPLDWSEVYGTPASNALNLATLRYRIAQGQSCVAIPRWHDGAGAIDSEALHATALLGLCTSFDAFDHASGPLHSVSLRFDGAPA